MNSTMNSSNASTSPTSGTNNPLASHMQQQEEQQTPPSAVSTSAAAATEDDQSDIQQLSHFSRSGGVEVDSNVGGGYSGPKHQKLSTANSGTASDSRGEGEGGREERIVQEEKSVVEKHLADSKNVDVSTRVPSHLQLAYKLVHLLETVPFMSPVRPVPKQGGGGERGNNRHHSTNNEGNAATDQYGSTLSAATHAAVDLSALASEHEKHDDVDAQEEAEELSPFKRNRFDFLSSSANFFYDSDRLEHQFLLYEYERCSGRLLAFIVIYAIGSFALYIITDEERAPFYKRAALAATIMCVLLISAEIAIQQIVKKTKANLLRLSRMAAKLELGGSKREVEEEEEEVDPRLQKPSYVRKQKEKMVNKIVTMARLHEVVCIIAVLFITVTSAIGYQSTQDRCVYVSVKDRYTSDTKTDLLDDYEQCPQHVYSYYFGFQLIPLVVGQPRFMFVVFAHVVSFIMVVLMVRFHNITLQMHVFLYGICVLYLLFSAMLKFVDEQQNRHRFEVRRALQKYVGMLKERSAALKEFVAKITPVHLRPKLEQGGSDANIFRADVSHQTLCLVLNLRSVTQFMHSMVPDKSASIVAQFHAFVEKESPSYSMHHIRSFGDTIVFVANLFMEDARTSKAAVMNALLFVNSCVWPVAPPFDRLGLCSGLALGSLSGMPLGKQFIRYDVVGHALEEAQELALTCPLGDCDREEYKLHASPAVWSLASDDLVFDDDGCDDDGTVTSSLEPNNGVVESTQQAAKALPTRPRVVTGVSMEALKQTRNDLKKEKQENPTKTLTTPTLDDAGSSKTAKSGSSHVSEPAKKKDFAEDWTDEQEDGASGVEEEFSTFFQEVESQIRDDEISKRQQKSSNFEGADGEQGHNNGTDNNGVDDEDDEMLYRPQRVSHLIKMENEDGSDVSSSPIGVTNSHKQQNSNNAFDYLQNDIVDESSTASSSRGLNPAVTTYCLYIGAKMVSPLVERACAAYQLIRHRSSFILINATLLVFLLFTCVGVCVEKKSDIKDGDTKAIAFVITISCGHALLIGNLVHIFVSSRRLNGRRTETSLVEYHQQQFGTKNIVVALFGFFLIATAMPAFTKPSVISDDIGFLMWLLCIGSIYMGAPLGLNIGWQYCMLVMYFITLFAIKPVLVMQSNFYALALFAVMTNAALLQHRLERNLFSTLIRIYETLQQVQNHDRVRFAVMQSVVPREVQHRLTSTNSGHQMSAASPSLSLTHDEASLSLVSADNFSFIANFSPDPLGRLQCWSSADSVVMHIQTTPTVVMSTTNRSQSGSSSLKTSTQQSAMASGATMTALHSPLVQQEAQNPYITTVSGSAGPSSRSSVVTGGGATSTASSSGAPAGEGKEQPLTTPALRTSPSTSGTTTVGGPIDDVIALSEIQQRSQAIANVIEAAVSNTRFGRLSIVKAFGGGFTIAGPLEIENAATRSKTGKKEGSGLIEAVFDAMEVAEYLHKHAPKAKFAFTASVVYEQIVNILRVSAFPSFEVMGPAAYQSQSICSAAFPQSGVFVTEKFAQLFVQSKLEEQTTTQHLGGSSGTGGSSSASRSGGPSQASTNVVSLDGDPLGALQGELSKVADNASSSATSSNAHTAVGANHHQQYFANAESWRIRNLGAVRICRALFQQQQPQTTVASKSNKLTLSK